MALLSKQKVFVEEYLKCWNATEAAKRAGYSEKTAYSIGSENLKKPEIKAAIDERIAELKMSADEVLTRLADEGRVDIGDFVDVDEDGKWSINLNKAAAAGKTHLIKKLGYNQYGPTLELVDGQAAKVHIGKHLGLFTEKHEHSGKIEVVDPREQLAHLLDSLAPETPAAADSDEPDAPGG